MDMEQNQPALGSMAVGNKYSLTSDIMRDVQHSKHFQQSFQSSFFSFVDVLGALRFQMTPDIRDRLRQVFSLSFLIKHSPDEFVSGLMFKEFSESKRSAEYLALFQNAFIYAVAACYKSQIKKTYMLASKTTRTEAQNTEFMMTSKVNGSYLVGSPDDRAKHSDEAYIEYVITTHPLFTMFVKSKHRFQSKKILTVAGYLVNPNLDKE
jgi:hypothetical protein